MVCCFFHFLNVHIKSVREVRDIESKNLFLSVWRSTLNPFRLVLIYLETSVKNCEIKIREDVGLMMDLEEKKQDVIAVLSVWKRSREGEGQLPNIEQKRFNREDK